MAERVHLLRHSRWCDGPVHTRVRAHTHTHARTHTHTQGTSENCVLGMGGGGGDFFHYLLILLCLLSLSFFLKFSLKDVKRSMWGVWPPGPRTTPPSVAFCGFCLVRLFVAATGEGQSERRRPGGLREGPGTRGQGGLCLQTAGGGGGRECAFQPCPHYTLSSYCIEKYFYICNVFWLCGIWGLSSLARN